MYKKKISIIVTSLNSEKTIEKTLYSIANQTNNNFELIVIDGNSTDRTVELINKYKFIIDIFVSEKDLGIYDAINKGLSMTNCNYYLIVGSDDILYPNAVATYLYNLDDSIDILTANYLYKNNIISLTKGPDWLYGPRNKITGHSLGSLIKKNLHDIYGLYSLDLRVASDTIFLLKVIKAGSHIKHCNKSIGIFGQNGVSNESYFKTSYEHMIAHYKAGSNLFLQIILFIFKQIFFILKYYLLTKIFRK